MNLVHASGDRIYSGIKQPNSPGSEPSGTAAYDSITGGLHQPLQKFPAGWCFEHSPLNPASDSFYYYFFSLDLFYPILPRGTAHEHTTAGF
jgi:hypothetical protein